VSDEVLLQQVRQLRAKGASPKEIARALRVPPAKIAPLVRLIAAHNAELQHRSEIVECWVSPGWHEGLTFQPHPDWPVSRGAPDGTGGLATVMVARPDQRSRSAVCVYLVDTFCLGVKNVIGPETVSNNRLNKLRYRVFAGYDELAVPAPLELAQHLCVWRGRVRSRARVRTPSRLRDRSWPPRCVVGTLPNSIRVQRIPLLYRGSVRRC
jgi:hypothetical protein